MSLQDTLFGMLAVAGGIVLGTLLTWIVSYLVGKRVLTRFLKSLSNDAEVREAIQALIKKADPDRERKWAEEQEAEAKQK